MLRARFLRWLGTFAFWGVGLLAVAATGGLVYLNHTGLPQPWCGAVEQELAKHGILADIAKLRYVPLRGIVADDVRVFHHDAERTETAHFERLVFDADKAQLLRGRFRLTRIELHDARVVLPTDPDHPAPPLVLDHLQGRVLIGAGRRIEVRDASGRIGGVEIELAARIEGYRNRPGYDSEDRRQDMVRRELIARVSTELERWNIDPTRPPRLRLQLEGDLANGSSLRANFGIAASSLGRDGYNLNDVEIEGTWDRGLVSLHTARARDEIGLLDGHLDCDLNRRHARFRGTSGLDVARLVRVLTRANPLTDLAFASPPRIDAEGSVDWSGETPVIRAVGHIACGPLSFRGVQFEGFEADFAHDTDQTYVRNGVVRHRDGTAEGRALVRPREIRYAIDSKLPLAIYRPIFAGQPLDQFFLRDVEEFPDTSIHVRIDGMLDPGDLRNWACAGHADSTRIVYKGARLREFHGDFDMSELEFRFTNSSTVFDDAAYPLRKQGPAGGRASAVSVVVDNAEQLVHIRGLRGTFWPALMIRPFNPDVAKTLETYRFHAAPDLESEGVIDFSPSGRRTDLVTRFRTRYPADYDFLGKDVLLGEPAAEVRVTGTRTEIRGLKATAFDGRIECDMTVRHAQNPQLMDGEFLWTKLSLPAIGTVYGFEQKGEGKVTGRLDFNGPVGGAKGLDGKGLVALENGELFSVPIFGPLSPLLRAILGERHGYQRAENAFCTFTIDDGILATRDFNTRTTSLAFVGDGTVDLDRMTMEMTMRMNARGLLGVITLPLRPFYGLFQFRGTGSLADPDWRSVMFTPLPEGSDEALLEPPKARPVGEAPPKAKPVEERPFSLPRLNRALPSDGSDTPPKPAGRR